MNSVSIYRHFCYTNPLSSLKPAGHTKLYYTAVLRQDYIAGVLARTFHRSTANLA